LRRRPWPEPANACAARRIGAEHEQHEHGGEDRQVADELGVTAPPPRLDGKLLRHPRRGGMVAIAIERRLQQHQGHQLPETTRPGQ
jgi:hypothetical protein